MPTAKETILFVFCMFLLACLFLLCYYANQWYIDAHYCTQYTSWLDTLKNCTHIPTILC